jgi:hypothetical protein
MNYTTFFFNSEPMEIQVLLASALQDEAGIVHVASIWMFDDACMVCIILPLL